ncbi:hypothetical protein [Leisingera methylohalidivorans]|uniref:Uncharacterized protein n=1 Tax=Leisingera methylohalidivorans DSM 14336 TaxID=999552 RepID=V9VWY1_9RHOB|nr:hypothetical protein [Leisingera methylohalidivorans]AHD03251.1 hypothetical protein METH_17590 [Leisingera methylohalidivorans DSM 14336]
MLKTGKLFPQLSPRRQQQLYDLIKVMSLLDELADPVFKPNGAN